MERMNVFNDETEKKMNLVLRPQDHEITDNVKTLVKHAVNEGNVATGISACLSKHANVLSHDEQEFLKAYYRVIKAAQKQCEALIEEYTGEFTEDLAKELGQQKELTLNEYIEYLKMTGPTGINLEQLQNVRDTKPLELDLSFPDTQESYEAIQDENTRFF